MARIAVIGGGLAGLTAAYAVRAEGHEVQVLEASHEPGGVISSVRKQGFLADLGPNSMTAPSPMVHGLLGEIGAMSERVDAHPLARRRYVVRGGRPCPVPGSPLSLLTTRLLSPAAKLRLITEPWRSAPPPPTEESLSDLVRRRLGQELVDYLLDPVAAGVFAGNPNLLSASHAMPSIGALEARYGSLVGGAVRLMRRRRERHGEPEGKPFSFREGMATIPRMLARRIGTAMRFGTTITRIARSPAGWFVTVQDASGTSTQLFDAVICSAPAHACARIVFEGEAPEMWRAMAGVRYAPVAVVVSGYARADVQHPLDGFGVLVPAVERRQSLGTLFSSTMFPDRAPAGFVTLTTFLGGDRQPDLARGSEAALADAVDDDLRDLLGVRGTAAFRMIRTYASAIPQYEVGFGKFKEAGDALERANPGFVLAGSHRNGVAVGDVMMSGLLAAQETCAALGPRHEPAAVAG